METIKNKSSKRYLKVYYSHRSLSKHRNKRQPLIRLEGVYLSALDFQIGDRIKVQVSRGEIVITKVIS
jgi:hypothetical protein